MANKVKDEKDTKKKVVRKKVQKEKVKEEVKLETINVDKQNKLKGISKAVYIIAKIMKVFSLIGAILVFICLVVIPFINTNIKHTENSFEIYGEKINYYEEGDRIRIINNAETYFIENKTEVNAFKLIIDYLENNNINVIIWAFEIVLIMAVIILVLAMYIFKYIEKIFMNISKLDSPFTLDNSKYISKIANLAIVIYVLPIIVGILINMMLNLEFNLSFSIAGILYILVLFTLSYIFEYGYLLQKNSKLKIYENVD